MGDMFRSEKMALCQMFVQPEAAYPSVSELGELGCVQFRDLNSEVNTFQRKFVAEVRRCDELERRVRYIENELGKDEMQLPHLEHLPRPPNPREIIDLEAHLESIENEIRELSQNDVNLRLNYLGLRELKQLLEHTSDFFSAQEVLNLDSSRHFARAEAGNSHSHRQLGFVAGVVHLERFFAFERMLWRISHGNIFVKRGDLSDVTTDPETGHCMQKTAFVAFFQGEQLKQRISKVCAGFHASIYPCPSAYAERQAMIRDVETRLADLEVVLDQTAAHRSRVLAATAQKLPAWSVMVRKMKAVYHTLNCFNVDVSKKCLIGECWVPERDLPTVQRALSTVESTIPSFLNVIETQKQPPTYTRLNKFTHGFQVLIDAYGVASYREVNPALYTCITFPFLFAVMFGDLGHALLLLLFAGWMVLCEKRLSDVRGEIWQIFFGGRYIILLMALFALYTGFIYNDVFSKSLNVFGSSWRIHYNTSTVLENPYLQLKPDVSYEGVYAMGVDPIWQLADNKIIFLNSYKMKLSIIFGVLHMAFGLCMSLVNFGHFKQRRAYILLEFVPQMLFLLMIFGYMVFMMFFKWFSYSAKRQPPLSPGCAPSVLILFINMMLFKTNPTLRGCEEFMFDGQKGMQAVIMLVALLCIPWMLLGKPLYIMQIRRHQRELSQNGFQHEHDPRSGHSVGGDNTASTDPGDSSAPDNRPASSAEEPMSEIFTLQAIHTVEYVLSTISHTASYLRLWALSLAHAQLSEVLWEMVMSKGFVFPIGYISVPLIFLIFWFWSAATVVILVVLEGLSAFLHTLRLHWVEFMSKFYEGMGYPFQPFCFKTLLEEGNEDVE